jgi:hypothetical protein
METYHSGARLIAVLFEDIIFFDPVSRQWDLWLLSKRISALLPGVILKNL